MSESTTQPSTREHCLKYVRETYGEELGAIILTAAPIAWIAAKQWLARRRAVAEAARLKIDRNRFASENVKLQVELASWRPPPPIPMAGIPRIVGLNTASESPAEPVRDQVGDSIPPDTKDEP